MADFVITTYISDERIGNTNVQVGYGIKVSSDILSFEPAGRDPNDPGNKNPDLAITVPSTDKPGDVFLRPRGVKIKWTTRVPPGYSPNGVLFIPVFRRARYGNYKVGDTGEFRGGSYILVSKLPEIIRS